MNLNTISLPWVSKANKTQIGSPKETLRLKLWQSKCAWEQQNPNRISEGNFEIEAWQSKCAWEQQNAYRVSKGNFETEAWQSKCAWEYLHQCPCNWGAIKGSRKTSLRVRKDSSLRPFWSRRPLKDSESVGVNDRERERERRSQVKLSCSSDVQTMNFGRPWSECSLLSRT